MKVNFSKALKDLRISNNLTQKEFAEKFYITEKAISNYENGKRIPSFDFKDLVTNLERKLNPSEFKNKSLFGIHITNVIFNGPATIVQWSDGVKTVVKTQNGEEFDPEKGIAMAIAKRMFGNTGSYFDEIKKWLPEEDEDSSDIGENPLDKLVAGLKNMTKEANSMIMSGDK